jgi:hypothetical protein
VLDVASGEGYGTALLAQVARKAVGVEIALEVVDHASGAYKADNLSFLAGDARALPCADASFDVATSFETIEHFAEQSLFLSEIRRVLRPGGLFIVSTPDRDNYSPAESPANPFHVKELTGPEFDVLLRSCFAEVSVLFQRPMFGSVLFPDAGNKAPASCFERRGDGHFEGSLKLPRPQYIVAFASDSPIPPLSPSVYIDTGRLGMLRPADVEAELRLLQNEVKNRAAELKALRTELSASREMSERAVNEISEGALARQELASACALARHELEGAREEVKGLVAANEMSERACALAREELKALLAANVVARGHLAECRDRVNVLSQERAARLSSKQRPWLVRAARELRRFGRRLRTRS